ncbi:hypothetical protein THAOC_19991 [Thalassiosira oceanica]|uniref:Uncharacterized protein n=1 Tax=Thalassiosira oceanica TaxID=159749 RepID=K0SMR8_THAOC|nr:hypothetical protein THAOC_19991 [Thalassiosira oceanica]|eukprot:EJK59747.1 hypothetical protein THAOC_19991 [Thalassiosira oceanica]
MLDVLSSGGVTNGQALVQGPYMKIQWAVGVSRGRLDRRRGVEEALWRQRWKRWDVYRLSFRPQGGYRKFCSGNASPGGFAMRCPNLPEQISRRPAMIGGQSNAILLVGVDYLLRLSWSALRDSILAGIPRCSKTPGGDRFTRLQSPTKSCPGRLGHSESPLVYTGELSKMDSLE